MYELFSHLEEQRNIPLRPLLACWWKSQRTLLIKFKWLKKLLIRCHTPETRSSFSNSFRCVYKRERKSPFPKLRSLKPDDWAQVAFGARGKVGEHWPLLWLSISARQRLQHHTVVWVETEENITSRNIIKLWVFPSSRPLLHFMAPETTEPLPHRS